MTRTVRPRALQPPGSQPPTKQPPAKHQGAGRIDVRINPGLSAIESWTRRGPVWLLSDPVTRQYHQLLDDEYQLLRMLDGSVSFAALKERFERRDPRRFLDRERFDQLIGRWYREGLVESRLPGQADVLLNRRREDRRRRRWQAWQNPLVIRLPGFDPGRLLGLVTPAMRWLFSPAAGWAAGVLILVAAGLAVSRLPELLQRLPTLEQLATPSSLLIVLVTTVTVKTLHELGHAVACRHYGVEPKEVGLLLLLFTPCLYCDVSDAWRLSNPRQRMVISGAGMYIELLLAAVALFVWWYSQPGVINQIALTVMVLGSVNTLLINGNPLLRYDGYYLLSDGLGLVNLWQRSRQRVSRGLTRLWVGIASPDEYGDDRTTSRLLWLYGWTSILYRWAVLSVMLIVLYRWLRPLGIGSIAVGMAVWLVWFSLIVPCFSWLQRMALITNRRRISRIRLLVGLAVVTTVVVAILSLPLPNRMQASAILRPAEAAELYVSVPGTLVEILHPDGSSVRKGDVVAKLDNRRLRVERLRLAGELQQAEAWADHLEARGATDPQSRAEVPTALARRDDLAGQLRQLDADLQRLELRAGRDGIVWPVAKTAPPLDDDHLADWTGAPLDEQNLGAFFTTGTHVASVGPADRWQALLYVEQDRIEFLSPGLSVRVFPVHLPGVALDGTVTSLARINADSVPPQLADRLNVRSSRDPVSGFLPPTRVYQVEVEIDGPRRDMTADARADATVWLPRRSLRELADRWIAETFRFSW